MPYYSLGDLWRYWGRSYHRPSSCSRWRGWTHRFGSVAGLFSITYVSYVAEVYLGVCAKTKHLLFNADVDFTVI